MVESLWKSPWILKVSQESTEVEYVPSTEFSSYSDRTDTALDTLTADVDSIRTDYVSGSYLEEKLGEPLNRLSVVETDIADLKRDTLTATEIQSTVQQALNDWTPVQVVPIWDYFGGLVLNQMGWRPFRLPLLFENAGVKTRAQFLRISPRTLAQKLKAVAPADWVRNNLVPSENWIKRLQAQALEQDGEEQKNESG